MSENEPMAENAPETNNDDEQAQQPNETQANDTQATEEPKPEGEQNTEEQKDGAAVEVKSSHKARDAFLNRDIEASKAEHKKRLEDGSAEEHGGAASDYVKSIVFGGLDGIITTFAIVTAAVGANEGYKTVLVFGFANVLADAWSMGFGEFISGRAEYDYNMSERAREEWELSLNPEGEIEEMIEIYKQKGHSEEDAKKLVEIYSKDDERFVDVMMVDELGILMDDDDKWGSLKQGAVMFLAFVCFGVCPLLAYLSGKGQGLDYIFGISCAITGVALLILGAMKGMLTNMNPPLTALVMLLNGSISGGVSFGVGVLVSYIVTGEAKVG